MDDTDEATSLVPPPLEEFDNEEAAERFVRHWAMDHGYALTRKTFYKDHRRDNPTIRRRDFRCAKGGVQRGQGVKRSTGTRMVECPFEVRIYRTGYGTWEVRLPEDEAKQAHTCDASPPSAFSLYRKPTEAQKTRILSLHANSVAPRFISALLLEEAPSSVISLRDIYNVIGCARKERLRELTPIEVLIKELQESDDWASRYCTDDTGHVNFLFFAPHTAIELARQSPDVILIDATYRTNRYNMPDIHFMAVTAIGTTTSVAMCFVADETEQTYHWAISAFKELVMGDAKVQVFLTDDENALKNALEALYPRVPQLICIWHVNKNVEEKLANRWIKRSDNYDQLTPDEQKKCDEENKEKKKEFMAAWETASTIWRFKSRSGFQQSSTYCGSNSYLSTSQLTYLHTGRLLKDRGGFRRQLQRVQRILLRAV